MWANLIFKLSSFHEVSHLNKTILRSSWFLHIGASQPLHKATQTNWHLRPPAINARVQGAEMYLLATQRDVFWFLNPQHRWMTARLETYPADEPWLFDFLWKLTPSPAAWNCKYMPRIKGRGEASQTDADILSSTCLFLVAPGPLTPDQSNPGAPRWLWRDEAGLSTVWSPDRFGWVWSIGPPSLVAGLSCSHNTFTATGVDIFSKQECTDVLLEF